MSSSTSASTKLWCGAYGAAFHALAVAIVAVVAARNRVEISATFWLTTVPPVLLSAFAVYALLVAPYLPRRPSGKSSVLYDSAVGMFAEVTIGVAACVVYGPIGSALSGEGFSAGDAASTILFAFLWVFGSFFTQILVVGNAAGLFGWLLLKKLGQRGIRVA